jgi:hypothetical protein
MKWSAISGPVGVAQKQKPHMCGGLLLTELAVFEPGDLLGAIQVGRATTKAPEIAHYQRFCIRETMVLIPLDANGYAPICRVSPTFGEKWVKPGRPGWSSLSSYIVRQNWRSSLRSPRTKAGVEVTPEVADALGAEAEHGYDLSKAQRRRVGRPSLAGTGTSPRLSFRTTPDLYRAAQKRAKEEGRSVSDLAREAVARYVGTHS